MAAFMAADTAAIEYGHLHSLPLTEASPFCGKSVRPRSTREVCYECLPDAERILKLMYAEPPRCSGARVRCSKVCHGVEGAPTQQQSSS